MDDARPRARVFTARVSGLPDYGSTIAGLELVGLVKPGPAAGVETWAAASLIVLSFALVLGIAMTTIALLTLLAR